jgi:hypothetical protein
MRVRKKQLLASVSGHPDLSAGGIMATSMRYLANAAPTATGMTIISPDGTVHYISRAEAERFVNGPKDGEVRQ